MSQGTIDKTRRDNFVRDGAIGGCPVGSKAAERAIAKVGRAICGPHWKPAAEGFYYYGRAYGYRKGTSHGDKE